MCPQVFPQLNAVLEVFPQADDTYEQVGVVLLTVAAKGAWISEGLGALVTCVGSLPCVFLDVVLEYIT